MEKLMFATKINGTEETGLVDMSVNPPELFCICTKEVATEILNKFKKAKSYNELKAKIGEFYPEDEADEAPGDLCDLGEVAAMHFGFM